MDCDVVVHRDTYLGVFVDAGLDEELAAALYAVESDPALNPFAVDAEPILGTIARHDVRIAVLSDIPGGFTGTPGSGQAWWTSSAW